MANHDPGPEPRAVRPIWCERDFSAERPNALWLADFTYLRCWEGVVFFSFVIDAYSRRIVGWQFASHMRTDLVLDALRMAGLGLPQGLSGNAYESDADRFPSTMGAAIAALEGGTMARDAFGDQVVDHYLNYARTEQGLYDAFVTDWERKRYYERG